MIRGFHFPNEWALVSSVIIMVVAVIMVISFVIFFPLLMLRMLIAFKILTILAIAYDGLIVHAFIFTIHTYIILIVFEWRWPVHNYFVSIIKINVSVFSRKAFAIGPASAVQVNKFSAADIVVGICFGQIIKICMVVSCWSPGRLVANINAEADLSISMVR